MTATARHEPEGGGDPRVFLAIERTYLAWTRTALALMGFGFVVARLGLYFREVSLFQAASSTVSTVAPASQPMSLWWGIALVALGIVVQAMAMIERRDYVRRFQNGEPIAPPRWSLARLTGLVLIAIGLAMAVQLLSLL